MAKSYKMGQERLKTVDVVIASGASTSTAVDAGGGKLVGFLCPGTIANAAYDVQASYDNGTNFYPVTGMQSVAAYVNTVSSINPAYSMAASFVRLKGSSNESADRTFKLIFEVVV